MKGPHIIAVGEQKESFYREIEQEYLKRFTLFSPEIYEVKTSTQVAKKIETIAKGKSYSLILLEEKGTLSNSIEFSLKVSAWLKGNLVIFVFGGASGHDESIQKMKTDTLSLSPLTFPHQMARIIFIEQLYRAQTILTNHPYHK